MVAVAHCTGGLVGTPATLECSVRVAGILGAAAPESFLVTFSDEKVTPPVGRTRHSHVPIHPPAKPEATMEEPEKIRKQKRRCCSKTKILPQHLLFCLGERRQIGLPCLSHKLSPCDGPYNAVGG